MCGENSKFQKNMLCYNSLNEKWAGGQLDEQFLYDQNAERSPRDEKFLTLAEGLSRILGWCFYGNKEKPVKGARPQTAMLRFIAMAAVLRPELLANMSYAQVGKKFHRNSRTISKYAVQFQSKFKIYSRRNRTQAARKQFLDRHYEKFHEPNGA
jgi:hypothetical protein